MKVVVIDGQGGKMGKGVIEQLTQSKPEGMEIYAIGTNGNATAAMMKAGADYGATGENPVVVACRDADVIIGPIGIVIADSLLGEVTPKMVCAVGQSRASKFLLPVNKCHTKVIGLRSINMAEMIRECVEEVLLLDAVSDIMQPGRR